MAAIAAIRPAKLDELLAPERHAARPTAARADIDFGKVKKLHRIIFRRDRPTGDRGQSADSQAFRLQVLRLSKYSLYTIRPKRRLRQMAREAARQRNDERYILRI
jgi:hypothetical protein